MHLLFFYFLCLNRMECETTVSQILPLWRIKTELIIFPSIVVVAYSWDNLLWCNNKKNDQNYKRNKTVTFQSWRKHSDFFFSRSNVIFQFLVKVFRRLSRFFSVLVFCICFRTNKSIYCLLMFQIGHLGFVHLPSNVSTTSTYRFIYTEWKQNRKNEKKGQLINENRTIIQYHKYRSKTNNSTCSNDFNETWKKKIQWHLNRTIAVCPSNGLEFVYFVYFYRRICWSKGMLLWLSVPNLNIAHETNTRGK